MDDRREVMSVYLTLPPPISTNAIWRSFARGKRVTTIKSQKYRDWITVAGWELESQNPGKIVGSYGMTIKVPRKSRIDLDNAIKAIGDLLQAHGVVGNDRNCSQITISKGVDDQTHVWLIRSQSED
jgi:Holliday junction resolvase RusA-like endonuclease